jgi:predicted nucleic acid-binding protein
VNDSFVLDSSVAIAWVVQSQSTPDARLLLDRLLAGALAVVPILWTFEVANSLLILCRRRIIQDDQHAKACDQLGNLDLAIDEQGPRFAFAETSRLAKVHSLSAYDAVYLELALRRGLPLASRDAALNKAAKRAGIRTLL